MFRLFSFFVSLSVLTCTVGTDALGLNVETQEGPVQGTNMVPAVRQFLGIPYAAANRWEAPQAAPSHSTVLEAFSFGDSCPQSLTVTSQKFFELAGAVNLTVPESEECLTVNIWAPAIQRKQKTAVMLWVYGGSFQIGTSNLNLYDGSNLVRDHDDITVVSFNYRINVFGQPNAPQLQNATDSQNFSLLDLAAAVDWVHANIENFGGDPARIVLFGESAGAVSVDAYAFMRPNDTKISGLIEQSGSVAAAVPADLPGTTLDAATWNKFAVLLGCGSDATMDQFSCMKNVSSKTMEDAVIASGLSFGLVVDDKTIFHDIRSRAAAGNFLKVPLLHGTNQHEEDIFLVTAALVQKGFVVPVVTEAVSDLETAFIFTCPAGVVSADRIQAGVPVWRYQFQGVFPELTGRGDLRAFHTAEIRFVFNTISNPTAEMSGLSNTMQDAWTAFAKDPSGGLDNLGWPRYDPTTDTLVELGNFADLTGFTLGSGKLLDTVCSNLTTLVVAATALAPLL
ncbi:carboxylesterase [Mycena floridula]|nr:carboxylesterase [Mycena floridula]